jgi:predicted RNase H-like nuclease (RuvC/YqgF family)
LPVKASSAKAESAEITRLTSTVGKLEKDLAKAQAEVDNSAAVKQELLALKGKTAELNKALAQEKATAAAAKDVKKDVVALKTQLADATAQLKEAEDKARAGLRAQSKLEASLATAQVGVVTAGVVDGAWWGLMRTRARWWMPCLASP